MSPGRLLSNRGIIRDQIHGFIEINQLEYTLLQHPFLRRLHDVKQLGMAHLVFPGATHTRFNHSLGVMHVSGLIARRIAPLARRGSYCGKFFLHCDEGTESFVEVARLSGLLHDIGHLPLSHQVENSLQAVARKKNLTSQGSPIYQEMVSTLQRYGKGFHEAFTKHYTTRIVEWLENDLGDPEAAAFVRAAGAVLGAYGPGELESVGLSAEALPVLRDIISNEVFDADRLDYLTRDATMSGVVFGSIDIERLIIGIELFEVEGKIRVGVHPKSLQTLEDVFDARYKMFKTVYYHHKSIAINVAITRVMELLIDNWDDAAPPNLHNSLSGPRDLYRPEAIADLILSGASLYTDSDFDNILYSMTSQGGVMRRWAEALLHRRNLLPVSLSKRPEALVLRAIEKAGASGQDLFELAYRVQAELASLAGSESEKVQEELEDAIYRALQGMGIRIERDSVRVELFNEPIVRGDLRSVSSVYKSLYLQFISRLGKIRPLFAFAYSDSAEDHRMIYEAREKLRRVYEEFLVDKVREIVRR